MENDKKLLYYYEHMVNWEKRLNFDGPFIVNVLKSTKAKTVLDCGCGIGKHTLFLRKYGFAADENLKGETFNPNNSKDLVFLAQKI